MPIRDSKRILLKQKILQLVLEVPKHNYSMVTSLSNVSNADGFISDAYDVLNPQFDR